MTRRVLFVLTTAAAVAALALGAAACGDDDDDGGDAAATTAAPTELTLTGETTSLTLDPATAGVLQDNMVTVAPVDPATAAAGGAIAFPIAGGTLEAESLAGTIEHTGGLRFTAGGTTLEATDFVVDTAAGTLTATVDGARVPLLNVDLTGLQRSDEAGTIVLEGITTTLTAEASTALNDTFGVMLFEEGLAIGDVTVRATD
jgi:hypothetical protein